MIREGLMSGSLLLVHDGSYMKKVDANVCSAAYVIHCRKTGNEARGSVVERSETADNYRAEFLGAMCILLIIKAAMTDSTQTG